MSAIPNGAAGLSSARELFFVGSISLPDAAAVFNEVGGLLGHAIRRIPDGETGERLGWLEWLGPGMAANPLLEAVSSEGDWRNVTAPDKWKHRTWFRLISGAAADDVVFDDIGYARNAIASFAEFRKAKDAGVLPGHVRFMIAIPTPFNAVNQHFAPDCRAVLEPRWEDGLKNDVGRIAAALPHDEISIQWDCAHDMQAYDGARETWFEPARPGIAERMLRMGAHVPADIEMGYHLCYGSFGGKHFVEPRDTGAMVDLANRLVAGLSRPLHWLHMPVPVGRDDDAYFAPLDGLEKRPETAVYLGLIHDSDGEAGTERRMAAASRHLPRYGIATECGFGRRPPETVAGLLDLHARLAR